MTSSYCDRKISGVHCNYFALIQHLFHNRMAYSLVILLWFVSIHWTSWYTRLRMIENLTTRLDQNKHQINPYIDFRHIYWKVIHTLFRQCWQTTILYQYISMYPSKRWDNGDSWDLCNFHWSERVSLNSLAPGRFVCDFENSISNLVSLIGILRSLYDNALRWMPQNITGDKSILGQVMAWYRQATSHSLSQCWPRCMSPYGVIRPQWVNVTVRTKPK